MKQIPLSNSLLTYLDHLEFSEAALAADPDTEDLAKPYTQQIADWPKTFEKERASRRQVVRSQAIVQVSNTQIDRTTLRFGTQLLGESNNDRKSGLFRRYFPSSPSEFVRQPLRAQCEHTVSVISPELGKLDKASPLKAYGPLLDKQAKAALSALAARTQAKAARGITASDTEEWKEDVNRLRLGTYAALLKIAAEKGYGKAWADTFFLSPSHNEQNEDSADPPPPATA